MTFQASVPIWREGDLHGQGGPVPEVCDGPRQGDCTQ